MLPSAIELADQSRLYDNSYDGLENTVQAVIDQAFTVTPTSSDRFTVQIGAILEPWGESAIEALSQRQSQRMEFEQYAREHGLHVMTADISSGAYAGRPVGPASGDLFATIQDAAGGPTLVIHDRLAFMPQQLPALDEALQTGWFAVRYSTEHEPAIQSADTPRANPRANPPRPF